MCVVPGSGTAHWGLIYLMHCGGGCEVLYRPTGTFSEQGNTGLVTQGLCILPCTGQCSTCTTVLSSTILSFLLFPLAGEWYVPWVNLVGNVTLCM